MQGEQFIKTNSVQKIKPFQQEQFFMLHDHEKKRISFAPYVQQPKYKQGTDLIFEFFPKNAYHFINFNTAVLKASLVIEVDRPIAALAAVDSAINMTLPYNSLTVFDSHTIRSGTTELDRIREYGDLVPYLMGVRDMKHIKDESTWRAVQVGTTTLTGSDTENLKGDCDCPNVFYHRDLTIILEPMVVNSQPTSYFTLEVQFPFFSSIEDAGFFPIYNLSSPLDLIWSFRDYFDWLTWSKKPNAALVTWALAPIRDVYFTDVRMDIDVINVMNPDLLDNEPFSWKSISYEFGPRMFLKQDVANLDYIHEHFDFHCKWKNLKNVLMILKKNVTDARQSVAYHIADKGFSTDVGFRNLWQAQKGALSVNWSFGNLNYPFQNPIGTIVDIYHEWLQYFGKANNNGVEDTRVINYENWLKNKFSLGFDFSTIPQVDELMCGINTKLSVISLDIEKSLNGNLEGHHFLPWFGRNVLYILQDSVLGKIE